MNKKVSTILTCGLILGGSLLSSSAFAETIEQLVGNTTPADELDGSQYVMVQTVNGTQWVYGFEMKADGTIQQIVQEYQSGDFKAEDLKKFAWTIKESNPTSGLYTYSFENVETKKMLRIADHSTWATVDEDPASTANANFVFSGQGKYVRGTNAKMFASSLQIGGTAWGWGLVHNDGANAANDSLRIALGDHNTIATGNNVSALTFYKIPATIVDDEKLNELYNRKGFNFEVKTPEGVTVENIFADKTIKAINVTQTVYAGDQSRETGFPAGTYFVVSRPEGDEFDNTWTPEEKYNYLKACTFIAVSPTQCAEVTPADRATGKGFELIEIAGSDNNLNLYLGTNADKVSKDAEISINNAAFQVEADLSEYPFSIDIPTFRYLEKETTDNTGVQKTATVALDVINYAPNAYALASAGNGTSNKFIFKYDQTNLANALDFLKEGRTAAVYNIKFVSGSNDDSENGKYLTFGTSNRSSHDWIAKGEALANNVLATPAYQFVITNVDAETNEITFRNRESGEEFTTQLFKEGESNGKAYYSMAVPEDAQTTDTRFYIANVNLNNYEVEKVTTPVLFNNAQIELTESTVDEYAGFLNEEDGKMVTLDFGRDVNSTSNRLYAYVATTTSGKELVVNGHAAVTSEFTDAALWQLVRLDEEKQFQRSFVYKLNGSVQTEPFGDVVTMPLYKLQYIEDAAESGLYLRQTTSAYDLQNETAASKFIVRLNADGSVDLMGENSADEYSDKMVISSSSNGLKVNGSNYDYEVQYTYSTEEAAMNIKTYLGEISPIMSYPEEEGHVSIQSINGNYISMNEDRDGIVVVNDPEVYYLHVTDKDAIVPSFYISRGMGEGSTAESERLFLFNPVDSAKYYVGPGEYNRLYSWDKDHDKALFKTGIMNATRDTLTLTVKGEADKKVAMKADNKNTWGGLNRFKFQIIETEDGDGYYYIRQTKAGRDGNENKTMYLSNIGDKLTWTTASASSIERLVLSVDEEAAPTANESVSASEVKVVAYDGAINIKNAAGKNVVVSTILGQIVANEVLTSDNATISVPAGIAIVSVDGEEAVKVSVK